jgi:hypothetical protein
MVFKYRMGPSLNSALRPEILFVYHSLKHFYKNILPRVNLLNPGPLIQNHGGSASSVLPGHLPLLLPHHGEGVACGHPLGPRPDRASSSSRAGRAPASSRQHLTDRASTFIPAGRAPASSRQQLVPAGRAPASSRQELIPSGPAPASSRQDLLLPAETNRSSPGSPETAAPRRRRKLQLAGVADGHRSSPASPTDTAARRRHRTR